MILVGALATTTVAALTGWYLSAHSNDGEPPECYALENEQTIRFSAYSGSNTRVATFSVTESRTQVVLGYAEETDAGLHTLEANIGTLTYVLRTPLGGRDVVDTAGQPIPAC